MNIPNGILKISRVTNMFNVKIKTNNRMPNVFRGVFKTLPDM